MTSGKPFNPDWVVTPGATLREWLEENNLSARVAAVTCRIEPARFDGILSGRTRITRDIAMRLAAGTGIPAGLWVNLERQYRQGVKAGKKVTP